MSTTSLLRLQARWGATLLLAGSCCCQLGCRQTAQRVNGPTPLSVPVYSEPELPPLDSPSPAPAQPVPLMPPASDDGLPPLPGTAFMTPKQVEKIGGFTRPVAPPDAPTLTPPDAFDDAPQLPIRKVAGDAPLLPTLPTPESAPAEPRLVLREVSSAPVTLDPSLFVLELQDLEQTAELPGLTVPDLAVPGESEPALAVPTLEPTIPLPTIEPQQVVVPGQPGMPSWPRGGLPQNMVISPGPVRPKWSTTPAPLPADSLNTAPRRLAIDNSDWDLPANE